MAETWCETNKECLKNRLQLAEAIGVKKRDSEGVIREFEAEHSGEFPRNGVVGPLSVSDVHRCVLHAMESLLMERDARHLPGHPKASIILEGLIRQTVGSHLGVGHNEHFYPLLNLDGR